MNARVELRTRYAIMQSGKNCVCKETSYEYYSKEAIAVTAVREFAKQRQQVNSEYYTIGHPPLQYMLQSI